MPDDLLEAIKRRTESATPGEWKIAKDALGDGVFTLELSVAGQCIARITPISTIQDETRRMADFRFIAHTRKDVPWLIAEVERLRKFVLVDAENQTVTQGALNALLVQNDCLKAEVERLRRIKDGAIANSEAATSQFLSLMEQRDKAVAEVERLREERDMRVYYQTENARPKPDGDWIAKCADIIFDRFADPHHEDPVGVVWTEHRIKAHIEAIIREAWSSHHVK